MSYESKVIKSITISNYACFYFTHILLGKILKLWNEKKIMIGQKFECHDIIRSSVCRKSLQFMKYMV